jgi:hypothetical protein
MVQRRERGDDNSHDGDGVNKVESHGGLETRTTGSCHANIRDTSNSISQIGSSGRDGPDGPQPSSRESNVSYSNVTVPLLEREPNFEVVVFCGGHGNNAIYHTHHTWQLHNSWTTQHGLPVVFLGVRKKMD